jgi:hypothetical protein
LDRVTHSFDGPLMAPASKHLERAISSLFLYWCRTLAKVKGT